jgi:hypothetical protein
MARLFLEPGTFLWYLFHRGQHLVPHILYRMEQHALVHVERAARSPMDPSRTSPGSLCTSPGAETDECIVRNPLYTSRASTERRGKRSRTTGRRWEEDARSIRVETPNQSQVSSQRRVHRGPIRRRCNWQAKRRPQLSSVHIMHRKRPGAAKSVPERCRQHPSAADNRYGEQERPASLTTEMRERTRKQTHHTPAKAGFPAGTETASRT